MIPSKIHGRGSSDGVSAQPKVVTAMNRPTKFSRWNQGRAGAVGWAAAASSTAVLTARA